MRRVPKRNDVHKAYSCSKYDIFYMTVNGNELKTAKTIEVPGKEIFQL